MLEAVGCKDPDRLLYSLANIVVQGQSSSVVTLCCRSPCLRVPLWPYSMSNACDLMQCRTGSKEQGRVDPQDLAMVRQCGQKAVETYREKAVKVQKLLASSILQRSW
jgi:hypothetical protein